MSTTLIRNPRVGESLLGIEPELLQQVDPGWRRRLALYTGRALTQSALSAEQRYRSGRMALLAQVIARGTAQGLAATARPANPDANPPEKENSVSVSSGYGFTAFGEDVTLTRDLTTTLEALPVVDAVTGVQLNPTLGALQQDPAAKGGVFVLALQPVTGKATGAEIDTGAAPVEVSGDLTSSAPRDPDTEAFVDWEIVDGSRVVLMAWPDSIALPGAGASEADLRTALTFRNRVAYTIFDAERALGVDGYLPWEGLGVALGVAAFDGNWKLLFFDRNAVVRSGGTARENRLVHPLLTDFGDFVQVTPASAEARLLQLLEQSTANGLAGALTAFSRLPPTGLLPVAALDLQNHQNRWFPANWTLRAGPIHAEELETALTGQMFAAPLDLGKPESIEILLPLSDDVYDPAVLVVETLAQEFTDELNKATNARNSVLQHRKFLQNEANAMLKAMGRPLLDLDVGLSDDEKKGRDLATYAAPADGSEDYGTKIVSNVLVPIDVQNLKDKAAAAPYTVAGASGPLPLFSAADFKDLDDNGLPHFAARIKARIDAVDDLINIAFLQTQTDIYRYRTNVLNATDAARLVTSPIIANIATRESAVATAQDLQAYISALPTQAPAAPPAAPAPAAPLAVSSGAGLRIASTVATLRPVSLSPTIADSAASVLGRVPVSVGASDVTAAGPSVAGRAGAAISSGVLGVGAITRFSPASIESLPSTVRGPQADDVTAQLPAAGIPFNLRTLSIAERLKTSPSHEALGYSVANRTSLLDRLLATDFGISVDDLEILVQEQDATTPTKFNLVSHKIAELRTSSVRDKVYGSIVQAGLPNDSDESSVFSAGITALDHHTLLLRAVEARVALYRQFIGFSGDAVTSLQGHVNDVLAALKRVENDLAQARQNYAFVSAIVKDELARIAAVNTRRAQILAHVPVVVFSRPRTLDSDADVPSRQLVPANVASPVPAALAGNPLIPPELREIASLLREAPAAWLPATEALLEKIERAHQFLEIAVAMQVRAYTQLQLPLPQSSATSHPGPYGEPLADVYLSQQQIFLSLIQNRAAYQPALLATLSWLAQLQAIRQQAAINDFLVSQSVHLEIARELAELIQNISKVATALYVRVSATLPIERLHWAEYLRADGRYVSLRSLAILPGWNDQDYIARQQMQLLVDWLFTQIDGTLPDAVAYMSDLVRTAILLASHAPVNDVIAGEVATRTKPTVGGIVPLTTPSSRVARGMPVLIYQNGELMARAIVDDLDPQQVYAKVTTVYQADTFVEASSQVHFMNQDPNDAVVMQAGLKIQ